jgi:hypothetical protein
MMIRLSCRFFRSLPLLLEGGDGGAEKRK